MIKNLPANAGDTRDVVRSLGQEESLEEEMVTPLQYSCLENLMGRGAGRVTIHGVTKSLT